MCCFNKVNLSAMLLVYKLMINKDCTVKNNNEDEASEYAKRSFPFQADIVTRERERTIWELGKIL